jgi:succinate dehydrogenase cytochrome b subunit
MPVLDRSAAKPRPVYLNLVRIRLPLPGIVSFLHRVSGAVLFLAGIPLLLAAVGSSLRSPEAFAELQSALSHPIAKLVLIGFVWAYIHHLFAGIRHLLLDVHKGIDLVSARRTSAFVIVVPLLIALIVGVRLW